MLELATGSTAVEFAAIITGEVAIVEGARIGDVAAGIAADTAGTA